MAAVASRKARTAPAGQHAVYVFETPDWRPPGLEEGNPFWLPEPWSCWMMPATVTPQLARTWLELNIDTNRNVIPSLVDQIGYDLVGGNYRATHQGIAFNRSNRLFDGQNRLTAITNSDTPAPLLVFWGVDDGTMAVTDTGRSRTLAASAKIAGLDYTAREMSIARRAIQHFNYSEPSLSRTELFKFIETHREALQWATALFASCQRNLYRSSISAAFFRAYYHVNDMCLGHVADVLRTGMPHEERDRQIVMLRDRIQGETTVRGVRGLRTAIDMDFYFKTLRVILATLRMEHMSKLLMPENLERYRGTFPFPDDVADWYAKGKPMAGRAVFWPDSGGR